MADTQLHQKHFYNGLFLIVYLILEQMQSNCRFHADQGFVFGLIRMVK